MSELPRELVDLYAAERAAPPAGTAARMAVRSKLAATVSGAPLGAASAGATLKVLAVLAIFVAAGAGAIVASHRGDDRAAAPPPSAAGLPSAAPATVATQRAPSAPVVLGVPIAVVAPRSADVPGPGSGPRADVVAPVTATASTVRAAIAPPTPPQPPEPMLVRNAWLALSANDPARALELVREDKAAHPHGALAEERDAIRIVALARLGRLDEARAAAASFFAQHPATLQRQLVERALSAGPT